MLPEIAERVKGWLARRAEAALPPSITKAISGFEDNQAYRLRRNGFYGLSDAWGGGTAWTGDSVTVDSSLTHSVVFTCKRILGESTGFLPLTMMQRRDGEKREATEKAMYAALHDAPNDEITAQRFRETLTGHCVLGGNAYAQILRRSGTKEAQELITLLPTQVTVDREKQGDRRLVYLVKDSNGLGKTYTVTKGQPQDILHIPGIGWDGMRGYSVLRLARHSVGTGLSTERTVARFFANGARVPYVLKLNREFENDEQFKKFRADWEAVYAEPHRAPILEPFIEEYKQIGLSAVDSQLLETRQYTVPEICRWFRISPHLAGDLSRATFANIEQLALEFVNFTLHVWLKRWEQELWRCVLTPEEKRQGFYWKHNVNALLRGDFKTRMEGYSIALQNGFMNQNEVRDLEDWNGFEGGDDYHIQLNMQTLPGGAPTSAQAVSLVKIGNGKQRRPRLVA